MTEHKLTVTSEWAISHSGQNFTGRCSCGGWQRTDGGGGRDYRHLLYLLHLQHVAEVES